MAHDETTLQPGNRATSSGPTRRVVLTLLAHGIPERVGARCTLPTRGTTELSRRSPDFVDLQGTQGPLDDPYISRKPTGLTVSRGTLRVEPNLAGAGLVADGQALASATTWGGAALDRGVVLEVGGRATLLAHRVLASEPEKDRCGVVGISDAIDRVRRQIRQVADLDVSVLIRGESGVGKELVAQAIHQRSSRRTGPFVTVNMAALTPSTAASALFGHKRGAFTGADRSRSGLFREAHGGTLFLDEIGEAPPELQTMLLRALETGEVTPVGEDRPVAVDVRVLAATDARLEDAVEGGSFRLPLLHRLSGFELVVAPLRERREDVALLLLHFLADELATVGESHRLQPAPKGADPWLEPGLVARLVRAPWPGNVRQLRNVARQLVIASRGADALQMTPAVERALGGPSDGPASAQKLPSPSRSAAARPAQIDEDALLAALRAHDFRPTATAKALGISKTSLYALIESSPRVRKARDLTGAQIRAALDGAEDLSAAARLLEVSARGLKLRMTELGLH
ncbi:MAG: sigma 54-interacting transcriptional regulator [Deltaproteobacteria bacterium]|nr:sigma 54-interacting transcriptional regulator [Deltaproteobacteria bacterium]